MATKKRSKNANSKQKKVNNTQEKPQRPAVTAEIPVREEEKAVKSVDKKEKKNQKKSSDKGKKPNIFKRFVAFIKGVYSELRKVTWLNRKELVQHTGVVAGIVGIFAFLVWIVDSGLGALAALFITK
ncbi:MAG: preprotein translocase subunit SecE [Eubacteriaceae bacterium]